MRTTNEKSPQPVEKNDQSGMVSWLWANQQSVSSDQNKRLKPALKSITAADKKNTEQDNKFVGSQGNARDQRSLVKPNPLVSPTKLLAANIQPGDIILYQYTPELHKEFPPLSKFYWSNYGYIHYAQKFFRGDCIVQHVAICVDMRGSDTKAIDERVADNGLEYSMVYVAHMIAGLGSTIGRLEKLPDVVDKKTGERREGRLHPLQVFRLKNASAAQHLAQQAKAWCSKRPDGLPKFVYSLSKAAGTLIHYEYFASSNLNAHLTHIKKLKEHADNCSPSSRNAMVCSELLMNLLCIVNKHYFGGKMLGLGKNIHCSPGDLPELLAIRNKYFFDEIHNDYKELTRAKAVNAKLSVMPDAPKVNDRRLGFA